MWTFLTIGGGVALILFAVRFLRKGLDRLFGPRLGEWMNHLARNRGHAFVTGLGLAVVAPSSTTVSVLAVSAVKATHLTARQALAVLLGANIGLTAMVLVIALRLTAAAPVLVLMGVLMFQYMRDFRARGIGQTALAVGFVFMGIGVIEQAVAGFHVGADSDLSLLVTIAERHPVVLVVLAAAMTTALQSSTATIALMIGLGATGAVTLPLGIVAVAGANLALKLVVAALLVVFLDHAALGLAAIPWSLDARIAVTHTLFNVLVAMLGLPLLNPLMSATERIVRRNPATPPAFGPRHLHEQHFGTPALVLGLSEKEILHAGEIVRGMLRDAWNALRQDDAKLAQKVRDMDNRVDLLDGEVRRFLQRAMQNDLDPDDASEHMRQLRYLNELETIGDIIDRNLASLAMKKARLRVDLSEESWAELDDFYRKVSENLLIAERVFATADRDLAQSLLNHKAFLRDFELELRDRHLSDPRATNHEASAIHLDLLTSLKRINTHVTRIGYATLIDT